MRHRLIIFLFLLISGIHVKAQENDKNSDIVSTSETAELIQGNFIEFENPVLNDVIQLQQIGNKNEITAIQQLDDQATYVLTAEQNGNMNIGYIDQTGSKHESLLLQSGNSNVAHLWSRGSNTQNRVYQDGNNNLVDSYIENSLSFTKSTTSFQQGNNNLINLNFLSGITNPTPIGLLIDQGGTGNMADITIDNYNIPYLKIEQTGGAKVIIQNSDFNYPMK